MEQYADHFRIIYFEECFELLNANETHLLRLESDSYSQEDIHAVFRGVHTIKGGAGSFGYSHLIEFAHTFETLLDLLRSETLSLNRDLVSILLKGHDGLYKLVKSYESGSDVPEVLDLKNMILPFISSQTLELEFSPEEHKTELDLNINAEKDFHQNQFSQEQNQFSQEMKRYVIHFLPKLDLMRFGNEPLLLLRALKELAIDESINHYAITCCQKNLPSLNELNLQNCYLSWTIQMDSYVSENQIREVFEFVEEDCTLTIEAHDLIQLNPKKTQAHLEGIALQDSPKSIRVDLDRIDKLVNTVGEMVIKQAMVIDQAKTLKLNISSSSKDSFIKSLQELSQHTRDLQESVMLIRAQPIKTVFARLPRLVRELSLELQKEVHLEMKGEATEIDKTVIERLGEPLTHMIRNAIDHGIEYPYERSSLGKPSYGTIHLSAEHRSGCIVIEIKDDGRGINREKLLQKAKELEFIRSDAVLKDEEIDQLIFYPGFSTVSTVTNVSGRGVGMDIVKRSIQALGGRISISSQEGKGCCFSLTLPLTLAVMDGMIIAVGKEWYVIPLIHIVETLKPTQDQIRTLIGRRDLLYIRKETIPLIYLHQIFHIPHVVTDITKAIIVILEIEGGDKYGLVVDKILGQQQVVLKSLEANYEPISGISAATILGNGRVALILDIPTLKGSDCYKNILVG